MIAFIWILLSYLLIHCNPNNYSHPDPEKDQQGVYKKGYIVEIRDDDKPLGSKEGLPIFVIVHITDATKAQVEAMITSVYQETSIMQAWRRKLQWSADQLSLPLDAWEITISTVNPGASLKGLITQAMVENFITKWNGINIETSNNSVIFDVCVYEAQGNPGVVRSEGFWGFSNIENIGWIENSYNIGTGIHEIEADYSYFINSDSVNIERRIMANGGTIVNHDGTNKIIIFNIHRSDVLEVFKNEIKNAVERIIYRRQFKVAESIVDNIISQGGTINVTLSQVENYLINMLDEE